MSKKKEVQERRDRDQNRTALRARRFTGEETLQMGLDLSNTALKAAGMRTPEMARWIDCKKETIKK